MTSPAPAAAERALLCDLFIEVGPDAPTRSGEWTTRDLAAHLVIRERRPDAAPGIVVPALAGYTERVQRAEAERPYTEIVDRVRSGPPMWSPTRVPAVDALANTVEFFVHHEDVRRAQPGWSARTLDPALDAKLADLLGGPVLKRMVRRAPVGLVAEPAGHPAVTLREGTPTVTISGPVGEIVLYLYGRRAVAEVTLTGDDDAITQLEATPLGI